MFDRRFLPYWATFFVFAASLVILWAMGRNVICPCGEIWLWDGSGGSQHLFDWYTASHLIHGFLFYGATFLVMRRAALGWRLAVATLVECAWEVVENTPWVINRYRETTVSEDYWGDAVINSSADVVAMFVGFWLALRLPVWATIAIIIGFEVFTTWLIRDGLALNILMLLAPSDAILQWQQGI